jgi:hypothetical protein
MITDNTDKMLNFKEAIPKSAGSLPIMPFVNPKTVFLNWLEYKFKTMNLKAPIVIAGEYPSQQLLVELTTEEIGEIVVPNPRGISVVMLDGSVDRKAIGEVLSGEQVYDDLGNAVGLKYGWVENVQMEFTYWSVSSRDRDYGGELVRSMIFEAHRTGHLLSKGILSLELRSYYDTADNRLASNNKFVQYSVSNFNIRRYVWGTLNYSELDNPVVGSITIEMDLEDKEQPIPNTVTYKDIVDVEAKNYADMVYEKSYVVCQGGSSQLRTSGAIDYTAREYGVCLG